jgi:hypothetical protein
LDKKPFLILFFLLLIPFTAYFFKEGVLGADSYGFLTLVCHGTNEVGAHGASYYLFQALPCNILAFKVALFCLAFVSGCFVVALANLFSENNGWRASFFLFLTSVYVLEFTKLENDQFAYPFLFASLYFFFRGIKKSCRKSFFLSIILLFPAAWFWQGAVFFPIAYTLNLLILAVFSIPILVIWGRKIVANAVRTFEVAEDLPLKMFQTNFLLNFGLWGIFLDSILWPQGLFFFALGVLSNKFWVLSVPFLVVGTVLLFEKANWGWLNTASLVASIFLCFVLAQSVLLNPPNPHHWDAIDFALEQSDGEEINNDWGWGYWVKWRGGKTKSFQSPGMQQDFNQNKITISAKELDCILLKKFGEFKVYDC